MDFGFVELDLAERDSRLLRIGVKTFAAPCCGDQGCLAVSPCVLDVPVTFVELRDLREAEAGVCQATKLTQRMIGPPLRDGLKLDGGTVKCLRSVGIGFRDILR